MVAKLDDEFQQELSAGEGVIYALQLLSSSTAQQCGYMLHR